jgi:Domain of unknown function (DUF4159)/Aerotolerance regulator N-terminal
MIQFFSMLQFATPLALFGLLSLPIIWWLLRFTPPLPKQVKFPPIRILLGLAQQEETPDKTPWWLLLLRLGLAALLVLAVAHPFLKPETTNALPLGHRLIIVDNGWAAAPNWEQTHNFLLAALDEAQASNVDVTLVGSVPFAGPMPGKTIAAEVLQKARLLKPSPLNSDRLALLQKLKGSTLNDVTSVLWLADGLDAESAETFAAALKAQAPLSVYAPPPKEMPLALAPLEFAGNDIKVKVLRNAAYAETGATVRVQAINGRTLLEAPIAFDSTLEKTTTINLPTQLRNEISAISIANQAHAGATQLFDDRWRKRSVALQSSGNEQGQLLLSPLHYVRRGLEPFAELHEPQTTAELTSLLDAGLSMLVLADVGTLPDDVAQALPKWIENGGVLLRFAGPRLAATSDTLLPVALRSGDRTLGSALSWETPQGIAPFPENSPFAGLTLDSKVTINRQVLAEPGPELAERTWASLQDGTPLVTAQKRGKGLVVLFHVTANADWSNLPLSGLFLNMLQRVAGLDAALAGAPTTGDASTFVPQLLLSGDGTLVQPDGTVQPVPAAKMDGTKASLETPPGLYARQGREQALNHALTPDNLKSMNASVAGVAVAPYQETPRQDLSPLLFAIAAVAFLLDTLATIWLGGGLRRAINAVTVALVVCTLCPWPTPGFAQTKSEPQISDTDVQAALQTRLAYIKTGDAEIDETSATGLRGLTAYLTDRTSATLAEPAGLDVTTDELVFYPLIYWPVADTAIELSDATRAKISAYMKNGGTIFFDTRDGGVDTTALGGASSALQVLLKKINLPPLEPIPDSHVLTRSFYLLDRFPGRYEGGRPWVEAQSTNTSANAGAADGVSSIIIGSNDYAAAWAIDNDGQPLYAVVPGTDRQREFAVRTGINLVMYALTGNYKADQVHVPALLERLGQ